MLLGNQQDKMTIRTAKQLEEKAYEAVRSKPFTKIRGQPSRKARKNLEAEACEVAMDADVSYSWAGDYGLLAKVIGATKYAEETGQKYIQPTQPETYDSNITKDTPAYEREMLVAKNEEARENWYVRKGTIRGIADNIRDALDPTYYQQLKNKRLKYKNLSVQDYFQHLDTHWGKITIEMEIKLKQEYYEVWDHGRIHITDFKERLDKDQEELQEDKIIISDHDKLVFYVQQMYRSGLFERATMEKWKDQKEEKKTWEATTEYFEDKIKSQERYRSNTEAAVAGGSSFESAANVQEEEEEQQAAALADLNEYLESVNNQNAEEKESIQQMATQTKDEVKQLKEQLQAREVQINKMIECMNKLMESAGEKQPKTPATPEEPKKSWWVDQPNYDANGKYKGDVNKGAYCWSCGFDPKGKNHDSKTCKKKKDGHQDNATRNDRKGGRLSNMPAGFQL